MWWKRTAVESGWEKSTPHKPATDMYGVRYLSEIGPDKESRLCWMGNDASLSEFFLNVPVSFPQSGSICGEIDRIQPF